MYRLILLDYSLGDNFDGPDVAMCIREIIRLAGNVDQPKICCCSAYTD